MIAVLFARDDSRYKELDGYDVYDIHRDARTYCKNYPVIAHPPCRAWGMLSHMANPRPDEKQLAYYLYEAAMCGRDIIYDQKYKYNLTIRKTIDAIYSSYTGNKSSEDWKKFELYAKRIWFSNGIHHHYSNMKMMPDFTQEYFNDLIKNCDAKQLPLEGKDIETLITTLRPIL